MCIILLKGQVRFGLEQFVYNWLGRVEHVTLRQTRVTVMTWVNNQQ